MSVSESDTDLDALTIVAVPYVCRVCGTSQEIYVTPRVVDGEPALVDERHRISTAPCDHCDRCERTHVCAYAIRSVRAESDLSTDDAWRRPTPPVPPTDIERFDDPSLGSRVLEREREDVDCPRCGGTLWLQERQTGERAIGFWDIDDDRYRDSDDWRVVQTEESCHRCGWHRVIA